jgi:hypothetical protein
VSEIRYLSGARIAIGPSSIRVACASVGYHAARIGAVSGPGLQLRTTGHIYSISGAS